MAVSLRFDLSLSNFASGRESSRYQQNFYSQHKNFKTMALDVNDLMMLKGMDSKEGLTPYEQFDVARHQAKKPSGVAIAGLTVASVGAAAAIGAWIFGPLYGNAKAGQAKEAAQAAKEQAALQYQAALNLLNQQSANTNATLDRVIRGLERETDARVAGDINLTNTVTDSQTGSQASQLTALQQAELAASQATQQVMTQTYSDFVTGRASLNPTPVSLYSAPQPCACPASGCGCGM